MSQASSSLSRSVPPDRPAGLDSSAEILAAEARDAQRCVRVAVVSSLVGVGIALAGLLGYLLVDTLHLGQGWMILAGGLGQPKDSSLPNTPIAGFQWYHPMVPSTAVVLLILASALFLHIQYRDQRLCRIYGVAGTIVAAVWVLAKLISDVVGNPNIGNKSEILAMSPITAASFLITALALLLLIWDRTSRLLDMVGLLTSIVALGNLIIVLSYLDSYPLFYGEFGDKADWANMHGILINPVAITTATGFLSVSLGLVYTAGPSHFPLRRLRGTSARALILRSLPFASLVAAASLSLMFMALRQFDRHLPLNELARALGFLVVPGMIVTLVAWFAGGTIDRAESERQKAMEQLAQAKLTAEKASRVKGEFLANMSHELRTPLAIIKLQAEELQEQAAERADKELLAAVQTILDASQRQRMLIDDILDLGKIEAGKINFSLEKFDLAAMIQEVAATFRPLAAKKGNAVKLEVPEQPGSMYADPLRVRQCIDNLLSNACKFTENGTVTLRLERENRFGKDWIAFHVQDTGIGMSPREVQKLFRAFVQADTSTTRKFGGTGLGLVITRNLCQMMGGDVTVSSEKGVGSIFTMRIPAEINVPKAETGSWDSKHSERTPSPDNRPRVLVIDDEPMVQELLARFLSKEGFHVLIAGGGEEGLRMAREIHPAAVTLDVLMPGTDGWTVLLAMKTDPALADIPVIMLTIVDDRSQGYALGASDYVTKPIDRQRLLSVLRKHCNVRAPGLSLLVEDDPEIRALLRRALENDGWTVTEAGNGREGLSQAIRQRPDVILLDLLMPVMDGFEFVQELRRKEEWREIPVVVLTAKELAPEERQWLNGQVSRILKKDSSTRDELLRHVAQLLASQLKKQPEEPARSSLPVH